MEQYFAGRKKVGFVDIKTIKPGENVFFANEHPDEKGIYFQEKITSTTFAKMGFKKSKFTRCDFGFCVFIDCYFKQAIFDQVSFVGATFINCNFNMAAFTNCDFRYVTFQNCFIPYQQMYLNLPHEQENLCADLCRGLSIQCLQLGEIEDYRLYLFQERNAGEIHSIRKLLHDGNSYYKKYTIWEGLQGLGNFCSSKVSKAMWGYGERISALLRSILVVIVVYSGIFYTQRDMITWPVEGRESVLDALYISASHFFSLSENTQVGNEWMRVVILSEHILGMTLMGFFVAALFRQINRRR